MFSSFMFGFMLGQFSVNQDNYDLDELLNILFTSLEIMFASGTVLAFIPCCNVFLSRQHIMLDNNGGS